jgi:hypothetical protein
LFGRLALAERPVPFLSALDGWKSDIAVVGEGSVVGKGPRNAVLEEFDDLPVREEALNLLGIGEFERA